LTVELVHGGRKRGSRRSHPPRVRAQTNRTRIPARHRWPTSTTRQVGVASLRAVTKYWGRSRKDFG